MGCSPPMEGEEEDAVHMPEPNPNAQLRIDASRPKNPLCSHLVIGSPQPNEAHDVSDTDSALGSDASAASTSVSRPAKL